jgi:alkylation response protein AidB-like acyl-CoA dehydrogenase
VNYHRRSSRASFLATIYASRTGDQSLWVNWALIMLRHLQARRWRPATLARLAPGISPSALSSGEPDWVGSDPNLFKTRAERDGDEWIISGEKWLISAGRVASLRDNARRRMGIAVLCWADV